MASRNNSHLGGQNLGGTDEVTPSNLEQRRQLAVQRYLDGDLIETICHEMGCSKSWLYKWKNRYQATEPTWSQEHSRRPESAPDRKSTRLNSSHVRISYAVFCLKKKKQQQCAASRLRHQYACACIHRS